MYKSGLGRWRGSAGGFLLLLGLFEFNEIYRFYFIVVFLPGMYVAIELEDYFFVTTYR